MNVWNVVSVGFREIWAHKFRSFLTMLGIILGVSSLVAMSAVVKGMELGMKRALVEAGGLDKVRIEHQPDLPVYQRHLQDQSTGITLNDIHALKHSAPLVRTVTPFLEVYGYRERIYVSRAGQRVRPFTFAGTWPDALEMMEHVVQHGRMFSNLDNEHARSVCVIGTGIRDGLFGDPEITGEEINPVGQTINVNNQPLTIVGMFQHYEDDESRRQRLARMEELRSNPDAPPPPPQRRGGKGGDFIYRLKNNTIYVPLNTMIMKFRSGITPGESAEPRLTSLNMKIHDIDHLDAALQQARNVLMVNHKGILDFEFLTQEDMADEIVTRIGEARISGTIISAISLLVGGIGIMNIMLASISERIREIGIRKAVGASTSDIFTQILIESLVIAVLGGLAGLLASLALVQALAAIPSGNNPIITLSAMAFAFACSASVGILAGIIPAIKACRLHPILALRYD